ncbi:MAG: exosome complex protein Rrp42 [Candidatus Pacearchaeota archaeon]|jgi:exosome complex component RRP42
MTNGSTTPSTNRERINEYLKNGKRFDERKPEEFREIIIEKNVSKKAEGSVKVKMGNTEVLVGIKMGVSEPYPDSLDEGVLMTTAELLPLSSERFENGPPKFPAIELGRVIDRILRESKFIDLKKLCIEKGKKVWTVFVDIYSLNDDGNLLDAAGIGAVVALRNAVLPKYDEKEGKINYDEPSKTKLPLSKSTPISITIHKIGNSLLTDPTREEEDISETRVTIGMMDNSISSMQKGESQILTIDETKKIIDMAEKVHEKVLKSINKYLD